MKVLFLNPSFFLIMVETQNVCEIQCQETALLAYKAITLGQHVEIPKS